MPDTSQPSLNPRFPCCSTKTSSPSSGGGNAFARPALKAAPTHPFPVPWLAAFFLRIPGIDPPDAQKPRCYPRLLRATPLRCSLAVVDSAGESSPAKPANVNPQGANSVTAGYLNTEIKPRELVRKGKPGASSYSLSWGVGGALPQESEPKGKH